MKGAGSGGVHNFTVSRKKGTGVHEKEFHARGPSEPACAGLLRMFYNDFLIALMRPCLREEGPLGDYDSVVTIPRCINRLDVT